MLIYDCSYFLRRSIDYRKIHCRYPLGINIMGRYQSRISCEDQFHRYLVQLHFLIAESVTRLKNDN
jgi:hypothetical protein